MENIGFFDNNGNRLNAELINDVWETSINFDRVGVGLHDVKRLYIMERVLINNVPAWVSPVVDIYDSPLIGSITGDTYGDFKLVTNEESDIIFAETLEGSATPQYVTVATGTDPDLGTDIKDITASLSDNPYFFDICFKSNNNGYSEGSLAIYYRSVLIGLISIYGESEDADERLVVTLNNLLDQPISSKEYCIFRETDVNEEVPDEIILNQKRKELLLEYSNIWPYLPSYIGLIRILDFFGFEDLRISELWKNVQQEGTYSLLPVDLQNRSTPLNYPYQKTNQLSLAYDIVEDSGEYDEYGIPITRCVDQYTPQEILIKLYCLKEWLSEKHVALAYITDIVGEAKYYSRYSLKNFNDGTTIWDINYIPNITVSTYSKTETFIEDHSWTEHTSYDGSVILSDSDLTLESIENEPIGGLAPQRFSTEGSESVRPDIDGRQVGDLRIFNCGFEEVTWESMDVAWNYLDKHVISVNWVNIDYSNYYEISWKVTRRTPFVVEEFDGNEYLPDSRSWSHEATMAVEDGIEYEVSIPYPGEYDILMIAHSFNGDDPTLSESRFFRSRVRNVHLMSIYNVDDANLLYWGTNNVAWEDMSVNNLWESHKWYNPVHPYGTTLSREFIYPYSLRLSSFIETLDHHDYSRDFPRGFGLEIAHNWNDSAISLMTWNQATNVVWDNVDLAEYAYDRIIMSEFSSGGNLCINGETLSYDPGTAAEVSTQLATYGSVMDFVPRVNAEAAVPFSFIDVMTSDPLNEASLVLSAEGATLFKTHDNYNPIDTWEETDIPWVAIGSDWETPLHKMHNTVPRWNYHNTDNLVGATKLPLGIPLILSPDTKGMSGISRIDWEIIRDGSTYVTIEDYKMFMFTFHEVGVYDINITMIDIHGTVRNQSLDGFIIQ